MDAEGLPEGTGVISAFGELSLPLSGEADGVVPDPPAEGAVSPPLPEGAAVAFPFPGAADGEVFAPDGVPFGFEGADPEESADGAGATHACRFSSQYHPCGNPASWQVTE